MHALNQIVEIRGGELDLLLRQQRQGCFLHAFHGFRHARHGNAKTVVHLAGAHESDLLDHLGATGQNPVGDQAEVPAVIAQALGPLTLAVGIAPWSDVLRLPAKQLFGGFVDDLFFVLGQNLDCLLYTSDAADE